jgi:hypothetical protein
LKYVKGRERGVPLPVPSVLFENPNRLTNQTESS